MATRTVLGIQADRAGATARLRWWGIIACYFGAILVLICRRPEMVLRARFYLEDGSIFYATAYNYGWWRVLFSPYEGYIHLVPRLAGGFALLFPLGLAPLAENIVALLVEAGPAMLLVSPFSERWGSLRFRAVLAVLYLAFPNSGELIGWVSGVQWVLALCALLIVLGLQPGRAFGRAMVLLLLTLAALTGPFCIFLTPIAAWMWFRERSKWRAAVLGIITSGAVVQLAFLSLTQRRHSDVLGAGFHQFVRILAAQIYFGALLGPNKFATEFWTTDVCMAVIGTVIMLAGFVEGSREMRIFLVFSAVVFCASLAWPVAIPPSGETIWELIGRIFETRYWFFPCLAFTWAVVSLSRSRKGYFRATSYVLAVVLAIGITRDFRIRWKHDEGNFSESVKRFDKAAKGETVIIPIFPEQLGHKAVLIKH